VAGEHAKIALFARDLDLVHVLVGDGPLRGHQLEPEMFR
jgi:hypothetical protein